MAKNRKFLRFAFRTAGALLLLSACYASALFLYHWAPQDRNGNRPRDVAKKFVEAVRTNDVIKAASFWKPDAIRNTESNFRMSFEEFCNQTFKCDSYTLSKAGRGKESYYVVGFRGKRNGERTAFGLYFERVDGEWLIVENLWIPDAPRGQEGADK